MQYCSSNGARRGNRFTSLGKGFEVASLTDDLTNWILPLVRLELSYSRCNNILLGLVHEYYRVCVMMLLLSCLSIYFLKFTFKLINVRRKRNTGNCVSLIPFRAPAQWNSRPLKRKQFSFTSLAN